MVPSITGTAPDVVFIVRVKVVPAMPSPAMSGPCERVSVRLPANPLPISRKFPDPLVTCNTRFTPAPDPMFNSKLTPEASSNVSVAVFLKLNVPLRVWFNTFSEPTVETVTSGSAPFKMSED